MNIEQTISNEAMQSLKALSDVNIRISEAHNELRKVQEEETAYLVLREKKAAERIEKVVKDSQELVRVAEQNYKDIQSLGIGITEAVEALKRLTKDFEEVQNEFERRNEQWERDIGRQQDEITVMTNQLKGQKVSLDNNRISLDQARLQLVEDQKKLNSDRGTVERAIRRLKEGRI